MVHRGTGTFAGRTPEVLPFLKYFCKFLLIYNLHSEIQMTWSLWPFCGSVRALSRVSPQLQLGDPELPQEKSWLTKFVAKMLIQFMILDPMGFGYQLGSHELALFPKIKSQQLNDDFHLGNRGPLLASPKAWWIFIQVFFLGRTHPTQECTEPPAPYDSPPGVCSSANSKPNRLKLKEQCSGGGPEDAWTFRLVFFGCNIMICNSVQ